MQQIEPLSGALRPGGLNPYLSFHRQGVGQLRGRRSPWLTGPVFASYETPS